MGSVSMSSHERERIELEIGRLNQRLSDIVNKQLYHSQISQAVFPPKFSNELSSDVIASNNMDYVCENDEEEEEEG